MVVPCTGGIGLLTVAMVSGSVVVLLVLGSHKLLEPCKSRSLGTKRSCLISSGNNCFCSACNSISDRRKAAGTHQLSCTAGNKCDRKKLKRVRFAADVVEPQGNNEIYRRRGHTDQVPANIRRLPAATDSDSEICDNGAKRSLSFKKLDAEVSDSYAGRRPVQERTIQPVAMSNIPANRRLLYNGMLQYSRMQRASIY